MKVWKKRVGLGLGVAFLAAQAIRFEHENPPARGPLRAPADVQAILERACYDCHSSATRWPWYSHVAPVSWLVHHDVVDGRRELSFSDWEAMPELAKLEKRHEIGEEVEEGEMPPWFFTAMHWDASLTPADVERIVAWSRGSESSAGLDAAIEEKGRRHGHGEGDDD